MHIRIAYDKVTPVYKPGETVSGKAFIHCPFGENTKGVVIALSGESRVFLWDVGEDGTRCNKKLGIEKHYRSETSFLGPDTTRLLPGTHCFPFSDVLPTWIPGSFEGKYGYVRHQCSVSILLPESSEQQKFLPFSVTAVYDLNLDEEASRPVRANRDKYVGFWCWSDSRISFRVSLDHKGYVSGEPLIINAECSNQSDYYAEYTSAEIEQRINFLADNCSKTLCRQVCIVRHGEILPGRVDTWFRERLIIPTLPPSKLSGSNIIDIQYFLKFSMMSSSRERPLTAELPILIGTVPLRQVYPGHFPQEDANSSTQAVAPIPADVIIHAPSTPPEQRAPHPMTSMLRFTEPPASTPTRPINFGETLSSGVPSFRPSAPPSHAPHPSAPPSHASDLPPTYSEVTGYTDIPPPSYNQSVFGTETMPDPDNEGRDVSPFAPFYVTYSFPPSAPTL